MLVATDDPQVFRVSFRDQTEEIEAWLTQAEIIEQSENRPESWLFVNDNIWDEDLLLGSSIPSDAEVTFLPRDVSKDTYRVLVADNTGYSEYSWTKSQIVEFASLNRSSWVFVNVQLKTPLMIALCDFSTDTVVRFMPGLVGGPKRYSVSADGETKQLSWKQICQHTTDGFELLLGGVIQREQDERSLIDAADGEKVIQLRSDLVDVLVGPGEKVLMHRGEYERIIRQYPGSVLAISGSEILRNGGMDTLCSTPDVVFEDLWSGALPSLVLIAKAC